MSENIKTAADLLAWFDALDGPDIERVFDTVEFDDFDGFEDWRFAQTVHEILSGISTYAPIEGFAYSAVTDLDSVTIGFEIQHNVGASYYLGSFVDEKYMTTDREATKMAGARAIVEAIGDEFERVSNWVEEHVR
jgi:hypothetical protein